MLLCCDLLCGQDRECDSVTPEVVESVNAMVRRSRSPIELLLNVSDIIELG